MNTARASKDPRRFFCNLLEQSNDAVFLIDAKTGLFVDVNQTACEGLGYSSRDELLQMGVQDIEEKLPEATWEDHIARLRRFKGVRVEGHHRRKDGQSFPVEVSLRLVCQDSEEYVVAIARDITERKRVEEALRESEERYRNLFENANDAIVSGTLDGTLTSVNRGLEVMLGWSRQELTGQHYRKITTPASVTLGQERTRRALAGERLPSIFEAELVRKDGSVVPVEVRDRLIRDKEGRPIGFQGIYRDISAKKELERQRTEFLAVLTHDIKNPLGAILGYTDILLEEVGRHEAAEEEDILQRLRSNVLTVHSLVTNYLDLYRIEAGHLSLVKEPLGLNDLLSRVGQQYEAEARHRGLTLELHLQGGLPWIVGDSLALERVFANLVRNALKFTPQPGRVTISSSQQNGEVVVVIADTGPGVAPEEISFLKAIFQEEIEFGLHIVKVLVEAHGGRIEVKAPGQGVCFSVFLPVASAEPAGA